MVPTNSFGAINCNTGEVLKGYMKKGEMKFRREFFLKRLFKKRPTTITTKTEFVGTANLYRNRFSNPSKYVVAVYKQFNPITDHIYKLYAEIPNDTIVMFDICAFKELGELVITKWGK